MKTIIKGLRKNIKAVIGVGLVAIAGLSAGTLVKKDIVPVAEVPLTETISETPFPAKKPSRGVVSTPVPVDTRGYAELIIAYKDQMVQFNTECQVPPLTQRGFKVGTDIVLDNRSATEARISFGGETYTLPGYGWKIVSLGKAGLFTVDCNTRQNVTTITVQQ